MRVRFRAILIFLASVLVAPALLHAQTPAPPAQPQTPGAGMLPVLQVAYNDRKLSVNAEQADLVTVLRKISEVTSVPAEIREGVSGLISVAFNDLPLEEGVERVLRASGTRNSAALYEQEKVGGEPTMKMKRMVVLPGAAASASSTAPEKAREKLSNGKEIEFYRGQFFVKMIPTGAADRLDNTVVFSELEKVIQVESKYGLKARARYQLGKNTYAYLFIGERVDNHIELLWRLNQEWFVNVATLYGMGSLSATFPFDELGRFRYDPEKDKRFQEGLRHVRNWSEREQDELHTKIYEYMKAKYLEKPMKYSRTWYEGIIGITYDYVNPTKHKNAREKLELVLEICNKYSGVMKNRLGDEDFTMYFPHLKDEAIFPVIMEIRADPRLANESVGTEGWGALR